ncbi:hypothetical protein RF11_00282 [Thelohanellus kitauei]|uniref:Uncharacterized protein n=1 Tax=Thelohanellus kitauei TaxID=669202 RepID=A0A0C2MF52_THEKT|nr:hypothetical protein RF11_00282 [Thelohanellus kitauei]
MENSDNKENMDVDDIPIENPFEDPDRINFPPMNWDTREDYFSSLALPSPWTPARRVINLDLSPELERSETPPRFQDESTYVPINRLHCSDEGTPIKFPDVLSPVESGMFLRMFYDSYPQNMDNFEHNNHSVKCNSFDVLPSLIQVISSETFLIMNRFRYLSVETKEALPSFVDQPKIFSINKTSTVNFHIRSPPTFGSSLLTSNIKPESILEMSITRFPRFVDSPPISPRALCDDNFN